MEMKNLQFPLGNYESKEEFWMKNCHQNHLGLVQNLSNGNFLLFLNIWLLNLTRSCTDLTTKWLNGIAQLKLQKLTDFR